MNDSVKSKINYKKVAFYGGFIFLIILGRVIFLDADLPRKAWLLELFNIDEGFYTQSAFNLYNYGTFTHQVLPYISGDTGIADLFQTMLTYLSLLIFGNNYYGVRMPSVIISLITIWLFYLTLKNIKKDNDKITNYSIFFIILYFVTDFQYLSISRIWVTTVFRIFFITLIIYLFSRFYKKEYKEIFTYKNIFIYSFLSASSIFFISIYNIFIYSAVAFTIFLISFINNWKNSKKQLIKDIFFIVIASFISLFLYIIYLKLIYNMTLFDYYKLLSSSQHSNYTALYLLLNNPKALLESIFNSFFTNIFRFNIGLLFIFLSIIPIFIYKIIKSKISKSIFDVFLILLLIFLFLQIIAENTFYHKRLTLLLPIILIIIFRTYKELDLIFIKTNYKKIIFIIYTILLLTTSLYINYSHNIKSNLFGGLNAVPNNGYTGNLTIDFIILNIIVLIIIFSYILLKSLNHNINNKVLLFLLIPNIFLAFKFTYLTPTFNSRNLMIDIAKTVDNEITTGKFAFSYRFYNKSIPVLNFYLYKGKEELYSSKIKKILFEKRKKYIMQNVKHSSFHIKLNKNPIINLSLNKLYDAGNGLYITLLNVNLTKGYENNKN